MRTFGIAATATIFTSLALSANGECDLAKFGAHPLPPAPLRAPPVSDQYARFMWGTDAYSDGSYWWVWNFIQNDPTAPPLALRWQKAGIYIPIPNPLPHGQAVCRQKVLGDSTQPTPILDQSAPIVYSVNNQTQDAAVFVAAQGTSTPPSTTLPGSDHARLNLPSIERFATTFQRGDKLVPLKVNVGSDGGDERELTGIKFRTFSLWLDVEPAGLTLAISDLPSIWTKEQLSTVEISLREQGFTVETMPPGKFMGSGFARDLGLPSEVANRSFLILREGTKAGVTYRAATDLVPMRQDAYLIMFDDYGKQPVASEAIGVTVSPSPMKEVAGITIAAFVGGISYFLGLGFQIPPGGEGFRFFATFGGIAGFGVGSVLAKRIASYRILQLGILTFVIMLAGSAAALSYMLLIATGAAPGIALTVWLALLLTITFFCLGAVLPLAGLSFSAR